MRWLLLFWFTISAGILSAEPRVPVIVLEHPLVESGGAELDDVLAIKRKVITMVEASKEFEAQFEEGWLDGYPFTGNYELTEVQHEFLKAKTPVKWALQVSLHGGPPHWQSRFALRHLDYTNRYWVLMNLNFESSAERDWIVDEWLAPRLPIWIDRGKEKEALERTLAKIDAEDTEIWEKAGYLFGVSKALREAIKNERETLEELLRRKVAGEVPDTPCYQFFEAKLRQIVGQREYDDKGEITGNKELSEEEKQRILKLLDASIEGMGTDKFIPEATSSEFWELPGTHNLQLDLLSDLASDQRLVEEYDRLAAMHLQRPLAEFGTDDAALSFAVSYARYLIRSARKVERKDPIDSKALFSGRLPKPTITFDQERIDKGLKVLRQFLRERVDWHHHPEVVNGYPANGRRWVWEAIVMHFEQGRAEDLQKFADTIVDEQPRLAAVLVAYLGDTEKAMEIEQKHLSRYAFMDDQRRDYEAGLTFFKMAEMAGTDRRRFPKESAPKSDVTDVALQLWNQLTKEIEADPPSLSADQTFIDSQIAGRLSKMERLIKRTKPKGKQK
ncbi:MAG: hypothetical protein AAF226_00530 [Verrucomicrobiota bacterium]